MLYGQVLTNDFGEDKLECSLYHEDTFESSKNVFFNLHHNFEDYDKCLSIDGNTDGLDNL